MMANISARNGAATMPNSTAAMPSSPLAKRRTVLMRRSFHAGKPAWFRPRGLRGLHQSSRHSPHHTRVCDARGTNRQAISLTGLIISKQRVVEVLPEIEDGIGQDLHTLLTMPGDRCRAQGTGQADRASRLRAASSVRQREPCFEAAPAVVA